MATSGSTRSCSFDGCALLHYSKGWCRAHYEQSLRGKILRPLSEYTDTTRICAAPDCDVEFPQRSRGSERLYCSRACRDRVDKRNQRASGWLPVHKRDGSPRCSVDGCSKARLVHGMCSMHFERVKKYGDPGQATSKQRPGEWRTNKQGYVHRWFDGEHQLQHRFVMEQQLGRNLYPEENVHHRNGRRDDNSLDNLELWVKPQAAGQRVEDLVTWVVEHYPTFVRDALSQQSSAQP